MSILKKRPIAMLIALAVILLSTLFGAHRSLGAACREVEDKFYSGVYNAQGKYTRPSIADQIEKSRTAAMGVYTVIAGYPELNAETETLSQKLRQVSGTKDISAAYEANYELNYAVNAAVDASKKVTMTSGDQSNLEAYITTFSGAQKTIREAGYNEAVREFDRNTLNVFPTNLLKGIVFVDAPALFE